MPRARRAWEIPEREATPEEVYLSRRALLKVTGAAALGIAGALRGAAPGRADAGEPTAVERGPLAQIEPGSPNADMYPAERSAIYTLDRPLTVERVAATHNNFYEFTADKQRVWQQVGRFRARPWTVEIAGLVDRPATYDVDALARRIGLEERVYRLRCVEAWAMAVPWTGFSLAAPVRLAEPTSKARYVRFVGFHDPHIARGQNDRSFPWPYYEALSLEEATNELAFMVTGIYGHELPKQHGAPLRLAVPWKYGFKSIKSITRIELVADRPRTFWNDAVPREYGFLANVRPDIPHPRWSQEHETMIGTGERRPTLMYNGYAEQVAHLYKGTAGSTGVAG